MQELGLDFTYKAPPDWAEPEPCEGDIPVKFALRSALAKLLSLLPLYVGKEAFALLEQIITRQNSSVMHSLDTYNTRNNSNEFMSYPSDIANAIEKNSFLFCNLPIKQTFIAADTIVVHNSKILGKPKNADNAFKMLKQLSGSRHYVITGCVVLSPKGLRVFPIFTTVNMLRFSDNALCRYIDTGEPLDKAGGYAIQGQGAFLVSSIEGSWTNVVGLPLSDVIFTLEALDIIKEY